MNEDGEDEPLYVRLPPTLKYLVDEDGRTNKEVVISALERELGVTANDSIAIIDRKIRRTEQRLQEVQETAREANDHAADLKDDLQRLRDIKTQRENDEGRYDEMLDRVLDEMEAGDILHLDPHHPRIDSIRSEHDRSPDEIHWDLRDRAADQDRDLQNTRFMELKRAKQARRHGDEGRIADVWGEDE